MKLAAYKAHSHGARAQAPPQSAKWRKLTLAALMDIGRKKNRAPNSEHTGES